MMTPLFLDRELAAGADDARHVWAKTKSDDSLELWKLALPEQQRADAEYWAVTGEYFETLWT